MQTLLTSEVDRKVTLQKKKKKVEKTGASATRRAAQADRGKGRVGNRFVKWKCGCGGSRAPPWICVVEGKWKSGASSCHEARHAQHGLPIAFMGYKIKLIEARASVARSKY